MIHITKCIRINAPVDQVYRFWQQPENLASFVHSVESITPLDENRSRWTVRAPFGLKEHFESEVIE